MSDAFSSGEKVDHDALAAVLGELDGKWLLSCQEVPERVESHSVVVRDENRMMGSRRNGGAKSAQEFLVMNRMSD